MGCSTQSFFGISAWDALSATLLRFAIFPIMVDKQGEQQFIDLPLSNPRILSNA